MFTSLYSTIDTWKTTIYLLWKMIHNIYIIYRICVNEFSWS